MIESKPAKKAAIEFNQSGISRYSQLATLFRRRIESGQWTVGQQIPTVDELAAECTVARATVRQALDILANEKLIERYRAKGTFVTQRPQNQMWCEVPTDWSGLLLAPEGVSIELLASEKKTHPKNVLHDVGALAPSYRYWRRRHSREGKPYYVGDAYIDERLTKRIPAKSLQTKTTLRMLKELPGVELNEVHQTITVGTADLDLAELLQIPLNAPVVFVYRTAVDKDGSIVFVGDGVYRADVVRLDIKVTV